MTLLSDPTPLIGRDRELEHLRRLLLGDSARLITITGPGGVGKTRLALSAASSLGRSFSDGVCFVDLVSLTDPTHIDATLARALHLQDVVADSLRERVSSYLRPRRLLLVLDNFEHVLPAAVRIAELLTTCPHLRVLVTSREPLNLSLEHRVPLHGLAVPPPPKRAAPADAPLASEVLFLERARLVQPDFALTGEDNRALAELLRRLDGLPLAIQITAARSNTLSPAAMLTRLRGSALLSTEEARDVPARHHTLRDAIAWSHALLNTDEQEMFRQLAVFAGGWTLEAAEAVVRRREDSAPLWHTLRSLIEKSLVQTDARSGADRRYRMLETIREYALERLASSGDLAPARRRHADYYYSLAEQAEREWYGPAEQTWLRRMEGEQGNLRALLRWAATENDGRLSLRLAAALADFWWIGEHVREGRRWLEEILAANPDAPSGGRVKVLVGAGMLACLMGDGPTAKALLQQALDLAVDDPVSTVRALTRLGMVSLYEDDARGAQAVLERSLPLSSGVPARWRIPGLFLLGVARMRLGDLGRAEAALTESLDLSRTVGSTRLAMTATSYLAHVRLKQGNAAGAAELAAAALSAAREMAQTTALWVAVGTVALVSAEQGDLDTAVRLLSAMDAWSGSTGHNFIFGTATRDARGEITPRARRLMGPVGYDTAVTQGREMSVDDAVDLARAALEPHPPTRRAETPPARTARDRPLLSDRERTALRLVGEGLPNKQIAIALSVAERTVKQYITSAMNKLGADNRAQAVVSAIQRGLL